MKTLTRTAAVLLVALLPLSPAAFASDRQHGDGHRHESRHSNHDYRGHYGHTYRHQQSRWHRHNHHKHGYHYGHDHYRGARVVLPVPPLPPVILPPHVVLHRGR